MTVKNTLHPVQTYTDSMRALKAFDENPYRFDVVITDMTMPQLTGMELARQMLTVRPDINIILSIGYIDYVDLETAQRNGIKCFLSKP